MPKAEEWPTEAGVPPLEALPTPGEEVLRRGVQSLISFTSSHLVAHRERLERWRAECADCSAAALRSVPGTGTLHSKPGTEAAAAAAAAAARADSSHDGMEEDDEVWE